MANPNSFTLNQAGIVQQVTDTLTGATIRARFYNGTSLGASSVIGDLTTGEMSGNGYPAGGYTITLNGSVVFDATDGRAEATMSTINVAPSGGDITVDQMVITIDNGTNYIYGVFDWASTETFSSNGTITPKLTSGPQGTTVDIVDN